MTPIEKGKQYPWAKSGLDKSSPYNIGNVCLIN